MLHKLALPILAPLLILQGKQVRRTTPQLPEASGARSGVQGSGPALRLLIIGDSSAAGVGAATQSQALAGQLLAQLSPHFELSWQLHATTGHTTRDAIQRLNELSDQFDVAISVLGVNDVTALRSRSQFLSQQQELRNLLRQHCGVRWIITSALPPMGYYTGVDFIELGKRLGLPEKPIRTFIGKLKTNQEKIIDLINHDYMPENMKKKAISMVESRIRALQVVDAVEW